MKHVIHFTDTFSKLSSILTTSSLRLTYCQEVFYLGEEKISSAAHPMVCFSKYSISSLPAQKITYGRYGIAFSDDWVKRNTLHPVLYLDRDSKPAAALAKLLKARQNKEDSKLPDNLRLPIMTIKCFTKNSIGYNSNLNIDDFPFIEENEWRFIPSKGDIGNGLISQNRSTFIKSKKFYNNKLLPYPLKFTLKDVKNIFVKTNQEIETFKDHGIGPEMVSISRWEI